VDTVPPNCGLASDYTYGMSKALRDAFVPLKALDRAARMARRPWSLLVPPRSNSFLNNFLTIATSGEGFAILRGCVVYLLRRRPYANVGVAFRLRQSRLVLAGAGRSG